MKVKIKKLVPEAVIPVYSKIGDAGLDLTATSFDCKSSPLYDEYGTGLAIEIPEGHVGLLFPRSSISKTSLILANSVGVVDSGYRGEIKLRFKVERNSDSGNYTRYMVGEKIGQLIIIPYPNVELEEVDELSNTERGADGFGSTGK